MYLDYEDIEDIRRAVNAPIGEDCILYLLLRDSDGRITLLQGEDEIRNYKNGGSKD